MTRGSGSIVRACATLILCLTLFKTGAFANEICPAQQTSPQILADETLCAELDPAVRRPDLLSLAEYEARLGQFFRNYCHRRESAGWRPDKTIRDTGPFVSSMANGRWTGHDMGTHAPVIVWYSPDMVEWIRANRTPDSTKSSGPPPDGAMMVKEMYPAPASVCRDVPLSHLRPTAGAAIMVRAAKASHDGWFWGWFGWDVSQPDWPARPGNALPEMGFGQYCTNCHASARDYSTFSSLGNLKNEPGTFLNYLSQDAWLRDRFNTPTTLPLTAADHHAEVGRGGTALSKSVDADQLTRIKNYLAALGLPGSRLPDPGSAVPLPSATYDNVWVPAGGPSAHSMFVTSDQCVGCHTAGGTGLHLDMTIPAPDGKLFNLSPYALWRNSPMGLAGRDPVFYAQLASEIDMFHPTGSLMIQDTCLGCHGVQGQRQFGIDQAAEPQGSCRPFTRDMVDAIPFPADGPAAKTSNYGALARDGVSCTTCHRMALGRDAGAVRDAPQNSCVAARQALLNPHATKFAATATGSFFVGQPDQVGGPFPEPKLAPMRNALGIVPAHDTTITSSEVCGTCHTVHLPILRNGETLGHTFEQTTYAEWAFSDYRTGSTPDGPLPGGAGAHAQSCQACHMPSRDEQGKPFLSKIASIQEVSNFPQADYSLPASEIDLPVREGYSKHLLVGLNLFLVKMAEQFPHLLGTAQSDPMLAERGARPTAVTEQAMIDQALHQSVDVTIGQVARKAETIVATVTLKNRTGHRFPSGVGFRRAFIAFDVLDASGQVLWASGRTNDAGVLVDESGSPIKGEHWWSEDCSSRIEPDARLHQPHRPVVHRQDEVQIYEELVAAPPISGPAQCSRHAAPAGPLTTSVLSICAPVKDNRLLPSGFLPRAQRVEISRALGSGDELADDAAPVGVDDDPSFGSDGSSVIYEVPTSVLTAIPPSVRATLYYQATPPYYLQDRYCTSHSADTTRLSVVTGGLNLSGTQAEGWKMRMMTTGPIKIPQTMPK